MTSYFLTLRKKGALIHNASIIILFRYADNVS